MKKVVSILLLSIITVFTFAQGGQLPVFAGTVSPAIIPATTGFCTIQVFNVTAKRADSSFVYKPYKCEFFPDGKNDVIIKDTIMTDMSVIFGIPVGLFHFKLTFRDGTVRNGNCQVPVKLPDGTILYQQVTLMKYPDPVK
jgi:hypothetical protein